MLLCRQKQQGMTITEVLIVLLLLTILSTLLVPSYITYITQNRLKSAAEGLYDDFLLARTTAIKLSSPVTLTFITGSNWCYGLSSGATACVCSNAASASNCNVGIISSTDNPGTTLSLSGFTANATIFDAARATPSVTGSATFSTADGNTITVSLNALGTSMICATGVGGYAAC